MILNIVNGLIFFYGYIQIHVYPNNGYFIARFIELVIKHMCQQIHTQIE